MKKAVLLVYGSGGHNEEMIRVHEQLNVLLSESENSAHFISLCDDDVKHHVSDCVFIVPLITDKFSYIKLFFKMPYVVIKALITLKNITGKYDVDCVITTGPGIGAISGLFFKFHKAKFISIENCSRFYSKSLTGRALYYLTDYFLVQNKELIKLYPKAIYKGRL